MPSEGVAVSHGQLKMTATHCIDDIEVYLGRAASVSLKSNSRHAVAAPASAPTHFQTDAPVDHFQPGSLCLSNCIPSPYRHLRQSTPSRLVLLVPAVCHYEPEQPGHPDSLEIREGAAQRFVS